MHCKTADYGALKQMKSVGSGKAGAADFGIPGT
jgi:hypothetical protein